MTDYEVRESKTNPPYWWVNHTGVAPKRPQGPAEFLPDGAIRIYRKREGAEAALKFLSAFAAQGEAS